MSFFKDIAKSFSDNASNKKIIDMYNDMESHSTNYRETAFSNSESNNGWYKCSKCGRSFRKDEMDADHIVPQSYGGDDSRENLQLLCKHCNRSKQDDLSDTFSDLERRNKELKSIDKKNLQYLNNLSKKGR